MAHDWGEVWWGPAPHKSGPAYRPWVIVSDSTRPFAHTECIALALTTQRHSGGIEITDSDWVRGGSNRTSYISPWYVVTIKYSDFDRQQGTLKEFTVADAVEDLHQYTPANPQS
jgi:mRNA-degrading endonuclease toxin of MazEF toxin-antitoxin module